MRIGLFTDSYFPSINGVSVSVHNLYEELLDLGHEVFIFTNDHDAATPLAHVIRFKAFRPPKKALKEYRIGLFSAHKIKKVRTFKLDIIHCHSEITMGRIARKVAKLDGIPFIYTYHTMYEDYTHFISKRGTTALKRFFKWVSMFYAEFASAVIFPTEKVAQTFAGYGFKNPYSIIPTGIDLSKFHTLHHPEDLAAIKQRYGKPFPHLITVGRMSSEKSIQSLLNAIKTLKEIGHTVHLTAIGDGPDRPSYEAFVEAHNLQDVVHFLGMIPHDQLPLYYHMADYFVSFSKTETQGLTTIEALASGLPVIAYEDIHLKTLITPHKHGMLFKTEAEFITHIKAIINDPSAYQVAAQDLVDITRPYDKKTYGKTVSSLYDSVRQKDHSSK